MPSRRLPSGGLAALAVVLASLAVVVVAGARPSILAGTPPSGHGTHVVTHHRRHEHHHAPAPPTRTSGPTVVIVTRYVTVPSTSSTPTIATTTTTVRTAPTSTTTTTTPTTTPTTVPPPAPTELTGSFASGTSVETRLGSVTAVDVEVPAGVDVHLEVTCGLVSADATSMREASVRVEGGGAACTATFSVPSSTPRPARWRLTAS